MTIKKELQTRLARLSIYLFAFVFIIQHTIPVYINSSFLTTLIPEDLVGTIYIVGSILSIFAILLLPHILRRFGLFRTCQVSLILLILSNVILATSMNPLTLLAAFVFYMAALTGVIVSIDTLLEHYSNNKDTGSIRGTYLTIGNIAWLLGPFIAGHIVDGNEYWRAYAWAAILLVGALYIFTRLFAKYKDSKYTKTSLWKAFRKITKTNKNLARIFMSTFLLKFFFAWMVIYTPIYLNAHIGLSWEQIGFIISMTLLAYPLLQKPLGVIADSRFGEKEILSIGFVIIAISTGAISFISSTNVFVWIAVLFTTRVGASMIEITTESYFFKQINGSSLTLISLFRTLRPWAYILGPLVASAFLFYLELQYLFILLGFIMLYGLRYSLSLKDTR